LQEFNLQHSLEAQSWHKNSNYIAVLQAANENDLINIIRKASNKDIKFSTFQEPDLNNEYTAIVLDCCNESKKICSNLKLALK